MAYLTINGVEYMVRVDQGRGDLELIESRRRAVDGSLLVDRTAEKLSVPIEITGRADTGRFFTPAEANAFRTTLANGNVTVGGDAGAFNARASNIGWRDGQHYPDGAPVTYRWVTATLEQV